MKKLILGVALLVILAIAAGVYYVLTNLDAIVEAAIEKYGSAATRTSVQVDKVRIKLADGSGAIHGLTVANPKGFAEADAFSLGQIKTGIDLQSLQEEPYVINEITIRAPRIYFEVNQDRKTNLTEIKKNLSAGKPAEKGSAGTDETGTTQPRLIIRRILFTDGTIDARVVPLDNKEYKLKLPEIRMEMLGGKNGATPAELAREIIGRLIDTTKQEIKKKGIDAELDKLKARAKDKLDQEKAKIRQEADSKVEVEKQKMEEKLKGILGQ